MMSPCWIRKHGNAAIFDNAQPDLTGLLLLSPIGESRDSGSKALQRCKFGVLALSRFVHKLPFYRFAFFKGKQVVGFV